MNTTMTLQMKKLASQGGNSKTISSLFCSRNILKLAKKRLAMNKIVANLFCEPITLGRHKTGLHNTCRNQI